MLKEEKHCLIRSNVNLSNIILVAKLHLRLKYLSVHKKRFWGNVNFSAAIQDKRMNFCNEFIHQ